MLALTLIRPWSDALACGPKPIENRSWPPPRSALGQVIAFHGGKKWDEDAALDMRLPMERGVPALWPECPRLAIGSAEGVVGAGRLMGYVTPGGSIVCMDGGRERAVERTLYDGGRWYTGAYGWIFGHRRALHAPVLCRGAQGLWRLPDEVERLVREQLGGAT